VEMTIEGDGDGDSSNLSSTNAAMIAAHHSTCVTARGKGSKTDIGDTDHTRSQPMPIS